MTGSRWRTVDCGVSTDRQGQDHAAAKSPDPEAGISRAVNSVIWRILLFYVGSIFVIVALMPYDQLADGSHQSTLQAIGIPGSKIIMDIVILAAVASCLNSGLYTATRILFSLSKRGDAPQAVRTLTETAFPWIAVLASTVVGFLAVLMAFDPDQQQAIALSVLSAVIIVVTGVLVNRRHANKRQLVSTP